MVVVVFFSRHREARGVLGADAFTPELEMPIGKGAIVVVHHRILYDNGPGSQAGFAPID
jgi:hypothetical protein